MAKEITRKLSIYINGKEVKNNLNSVGKEISKLRGQLRNLTPGTEAFIKKSAELSKARKHYKAINDEIRGTNVSLEEAQEHWQNLLGGLVSGNFTMVQNGLRGIATNIKGMTASALKFIATPIGAAIALLSGVALATKKWVDLNLQVEKSNQLIKDLTQESGTLVDVIRIRAEVLNKTFGTEIEKSVTTAKALVDSLNISYNAAFDIIEEGGIRGKLKTDEFLESLREYGPQFNNAGFSAKEFADVVSAGIDLSIYKDKFPDAIKEADLAIKEQTKATKESLVNAFGAAFTEDLLRKVSTGQITTKQALQSIAAESERVNLNQQQQAQLTADLFKGAGEDAGGAVKIFKALNVALNDVKKPLTEIQQIQQEQLEANKELKGIYTQLFATAEGGFGKLVAKGKLFLTQVLIKILKSGVDVYNWFVDLNNQSTTFRVGIVLARNAIKGTFTMLLEAIKVSLKNIGSLGTMIEGVFTLSPEKVKEGFMSAIQNFGDTFKTITNESKKDVESLFNALNGGSKMKNFNLENYLAEDTTTTPEDDTTTGTTTGATETNGLTPEDQRILKSKQRLREWLKTFKEEQKLQESMEQLEEDEAAKLKEEQEIEIKYQTLTDQAAGDQELLKELEEAKFKELDQVKKKWEDKFWEDYQKNNERRVRNEQRTKEQIIAAERQLAFAKRDLLVMSISTLRGFAKEGSAVYKGLFAIEKIVAAANVIINGIQERAKISAVWGWNPPVAAPLLAASRIRTATSLVSIGATALKGMNDGGFTPERALGNDRYGPITSFNHGNEYVVPEIVRADPTYMPLINQLETARTQKLDLPPTQTETTTAPNNNMLTEAVHLLIDKLSEPIQANALIGDDEIEKQRYRTEKIRQSRTNARIKP